MKVRDKSKEELQEQAKGFLDYADKTCKITEIQRTEISKILGLNDSEKKGFLSRLSYKIGKNIDISNMHKVEKALKKEYPDFGELYKEYKKYLKAKHFCKKYRVYNGEILVEYLHSTDNFKALNTLKNGIGDSYRFEENNLYKLGKLIFEKFPDISNEQFKKILENLYYATAFVHLGYGVNPGYCNQLIDTLNFLIKEYPELGIEDLNLILESWYIKIENHNDNYGKEINVIGVVKIVFEELKNISISTHEKFGFLYVLLNLSSGLFKLDFVNLNDMKLLLEKYPNVGLGELFSLRYISSATYSSTSNPCTNCSLSSIFEKYPDITIYELITLFYQNASYSGQPLCDIERINYGLITNIAPKNLEYLRYIFKIFPTDINIHDIKWIENLICNLYHILNHPEKFIIDKYQNVSSTRQLALLLDNSYHDEDFRWKEMFKYSYQNNNYYNFCEHYPNISSEDIEWLFKIFSQYENIELHCENLEIILEKYDIDLQTLANSGGLIDVLGQAKPGNLEIILDKYDIDLQTLTNSECLLDVLRQAEPGNLKIILDNYDIDLQTLTNSKCLPDILEQANPDNLKALINRYPKITLEELKSSYDSL